MLNPVNWLKMVFIHVTTKIDVRPFLDAVEFIPSENKI
jgi:hypothetical protein